MKKKTLLFILVMLSTLTVSAQTLIDGIYYNFSETEATVTSGDNKYTGNVTIPSTVTSNGVTYSVTKIGEYAFFWCSDLTSVTIPNSVTEIGSSAFSECSGLTSVHITDLAAWCNIRFFDNPLFYAKHLFMDGNEITDLVIPNSVTSIGLKSFFGCTGLTSVTIPNSVTEIGWGAFSGCSNLTEVISEITEPFYEQGAFDNISSSCVLTVPHGKTDNYIEKGWTTSVFQGGIKENLVLVDGIYYSLARSSKQATVTYGDTQYTGSVIIPETITYNGVTYTVTVIGERSFYYDSDMTSVIIPKSVTSIEYCAFYECSGLTSVTIPNNVISIGHSAFAYCSGLTSVTIGNSVTEIAVSAFQSCYGLTEVTLPNSVTAIGELAFGYCSGLKDVYCYAKNVPTTNDVFYHSPISSATLHVPAASLYAYNTTSPWSGFGTIGTLPGETPVTPKCATPTISYADGKVTFSCETEDVEFVTKVKSYDSGDYDGTSVSFSNQYTVSVYAKKDGYLDSDVATKEITIGGSATKKGDVNGDGTVNGTDIQEVINIIVDGD